VRTPTRRRSHLASSALIAVLALVSGVCVHSQDNPNERVFRQSKTTIEKALKGMQPAMAGRLPILDGFAKSREHPIERYQRGYYQARAEITSNAAGQSLVRIRTKLTAWYSDPAAAGSGYQLLDSNGRIEADILDQLAEKLGDISPESAMVSSGSPPPSTVPVPGTEPAAPAPVSKLTEPAKTFPSSVREGLASAGANESQPPPRNSAKVANPLQAEADSLEEIVKNTAYPKNLVAVKKSGTAVVATPSLTAKPEFLASLHDEFELLDFNANWVHIRISGLSRGWIWRNNVEMPEGIADTDAPSAPAIAPAADLFRIAREDTAQFPGDWEPLRSKSVKIISVQKTDTATKNGTSKERLEYAKFLLEKSFKESAQKPPTPQGIVVIFDSADGGMIAATTSTLQQWVAGKLSDAALWHQCFFDPPEILDSSVASGGK
jgi:hypothetical protein